MTEAGLPVSVLRDEAETLRRARREAAPVVLADLGVAPARMLRLIAALAAERRAARIVAVWPEGGSGLAATAMRVGAFDHLPRSAPPDRVRTVARNALALAAGVPESADAAPGPEAALSGPSEAMAAVRASLRRLAPALCPVLLRGETGTGKRLAADALARLANRPGTFREVDCAALDPEAQDAALFGPEGVAEGPGTLLLHEVCALNVLLQSRLLRLMRAGAAEPGTTPPRVICTTRQDPDVEMREGRLRDELRRMLGVAEVALPPLRVREADAEVIAEREAGQGPLPEETARAIRAHDWPGNLPELLETARALRRAGRSDPSALPTAVLAGAAAAPAPDGARAGAAGSEADAARDPGGARWDGGGVGPEALLAARVGPLVGATLAEVEAALIEATLARCGGSVRRAAAMLGVRPSTLYRRGVTGPRGRVVTERGTGDGSPQAAP
ncbi:MAG TPA: sigma 54-interacting transcriptional regulator [Paracoccaceae bacterium]|nr:sigma 54-interacting transcriptional regulator [Paracoccaceae bacterium]